MTAHWLLLVAALLLAGCATVKLTPADEAKLAELQAFTDRVTARYDKPHVTIIAMAPLAEGNAAAIGSEGIVGLLRGRPGAGQILLKPNLIHHSLAIALVAHELGHWVLGHEGERWLRPSSERRQQMELDANREAVRILRVGAGMKPHEAFGHVYLVLDSGARGRLAGQLERTYGHPADPCVEVYALVDAFPAYRERVLEIYRQQRAKDETPLACPPR